MSSNFEWQKFQANERLRERRREAEAHRRVRESGSSSRSRLVIPLEVTILLGVMAMAFWLLIGCTPVSSADAVEVATVGEAESGQQATGAIIESIRHQNWRALHPVPQPAEEPRAEAVATPTMARRIQFQDRREQRSTGSR